MLCHYVWKDTITERKLCVMVNNLSCTEVCKCYHEYFQEHLSQIFRP